jgi:hypothetical protein
MIDNAEQRLHLTDLTDATVVFDRVDDPRHPCGWAVLFSLLGGVAVGLAVLAGFVLALPRGRA